MESNIEHLKWYYDEHAAQVRQHENQRERITNILLTIAAALIGLTTYAQLSIESLAASITLIVLGVFGVLFSFKHYERARLHTQIMKTIRCEIDASMSSTDKVRVTSLSELRSTGKTRHYKEFRWNEKIKEPQSGANSWVAKHRTHLYWAAVPLLIALLGLGLSMAIVYKHYWATDQKPIKIEVVK